MPDVLVCEEQLADANGVDLLQEMLVKIRNQGMNLQSLDKQSSTLSGLGS